MKAPLLSIIIPIYNSEKYLKRCLESICQQSFSDFECIMVDDGSTDSSLDILNEYALKDSRVMFSPKTIVVEGLQETGH